MFSWPTARADLAHVRASKSFEKTLLVEIVTGDQPSTFFFFPQKIALATTQEGNPRNPRKKAPQSFHQLISLARDYSHCTNFFLRISKKIRFHKCLQNRNLIKSKCVAGRFVKTFKRKCLQGI